MALPTNETRYINWKTSIAATAARLSIPWIYIGIRCGFSQVLDSQQSNREPCCPCDRLSKCILNQPSHATTRGAGCAMAGFQAASIRGHGIINNKLLRSPANP